MDPSVIVAVLALISSLGGIVVANRYTARTARQAQEQTADIERKKLDATSWQEAVNNWKSDVKQLREQRSEDQSVYESNLSKLQGRLDAVEQELEAVERQRVFDRTHINAMIAWGKIVVTMMRSAGIVYPPPPPGVITDPNGFPPIRDA